MSPLDGLGREPGSPSHSRMAWMPRCDRQLVVGRGFGADPLAD